MIESEAKINPDTFPAQQPLAREASKLSIRNRIKLAKYLGTKKQIGRPVRGWDYHDVDGNVAMHVIKYDDLGFNGERVKSYLVVRPVGDDWVAGDPPGSLPLFGLPILANASRVYVTEGEKCALALAELGLIATTSSHGAMSSHRTDWTPLAGKEVIILPDADLAGEGYARKVVRLLAKLDPKPVVRVVLLDAIWRTNEPLLRGFDVVDWLASEVPGAWDRDQRRSEIE